MPERMGPPERRTASIKPALVMAGILALIASALLGANLFGIRDSLMGSAVPSSKPAAVSPFVRVGSAAHGPSTVLRSQPWWQGLAELKGRGGDTSSIAIGAEAIEWRIRWQCQRGVLVVRTSVRSSPLIDAKCPASGSVTETRPGRYDLKINTQSPWRLRIDQQVDVPLIEPPLAAMQPGSSTIVATGKFRRIDQYATGRVAFYRVGSGRYLMRLSNFYVTPNIDLEVRLSPLRSPHSTHEYLSAPSRHLAPLDVTAGSLNFSVPAQVDPMQYHSVVIWCPLISSAYAAAPLRGAT
jgi:hypothetical protein